MKIGLIDVDGHNFPNLPLMKLSAWHKRQGDSVEWYEPLFHSMGEPLDKVYMSKVFSFTSDYPYYVNAKEIVKGGSGYCISLENGKEVYHKENESQLPYEIEHIYPDYSLYPELTKDTAYGFMSRGCPRGCVFCHIKTKEGGKAYKVADLSEFWRGQKKIVLCDPNILACNEHMELLKQIQLDSIHFAYDRYQDKNIIEPKLKAFKEQTGYDKDNGNVMVYILCNFDTTIEQDIERIQFCRSLRFSPYPMIYNKKNCKPIYRKLQRWCNNFIFWTTPTFEEYIG